MLESNLGDLADLLWGRILWSGGPLLDTLANWSAWIGSLQNATSISLNTAPTSTRLKSSCTSSTVAFKVVASSLKFKAAMIHIEAMQAWLNNIMSNIFWYTLTLSLSFLQRHACLMPHAIQTLAPKPSNFRESPAGENKPKLPRTQLSAGFGQQNWIEVWHVSSKSLLPGTGNLHTWTHPILTWHDSLPAFQFSGAKNVFVFFSPFEMPYLWSSAHVTSQKARYVVNYCQIFPQVGPVSTSPSHQRLPGYPVKPQ